MENTAIDDMIYDKNYLFLLFTQLFFCIFITLFLTLSLFVFIHSSSLFQNINTGCSQGRWILFLFLLFLFYLSFQGQSRCSDLNNSRINPGWNLLED
jgi:hypothetical protein